MGPPKTQTPIVFSDRGLFSRPQSKLIQYFQEFIDPVCRSTKGPTDFPDFLALARFDNPTREPVVFFQISPSDSEEAI